ncbi:MAG: hypothetical protein P8008_01655 [Gammaproteobacteria bacterium]
MKRLIKFLHTTSSLGLVGGLAAYIIVLWTAPEMTALSEYAAMRHSLMLVSKWLLVPSMIVCLVTGLLAMAVHYPYHEAPWVWDKALSGILVFESTLGAIDAPAQRAAALTQRALGGEVSPAELAERMHDEWGALWIILGLAVANVALATWRPRFKRRREAGDAAR